MSSPAVTAASEWPIGTALEDVAQRARLLIAFADGQEEAGFVMTARRMRVVARDALELAREVHYYRVAAANGREP